ncbi:hypothetical protein PAMA_001864 [Pampus argenteus]
MMMQNAGIFPILHGMNATLTQTLPPSLRLCEIIAPVSLYLSLWLSTPVAVVMIDNTSGDIFSDLCTAALSDSDENGASTWGEVSQDSR